MDFNEDDKTEILSSFFIGLILTPDKTAQFNGHSNLNIAYDIFHPGNLQRILQVSDVLQEELFHREKYTGVVAVTVFSDGGGCVEAKDYWKSRKQPNRILFSFSKDGRE